MTPTTITTRTVIRLVLCVGALALGVVGGVLAALILNGSSVRAQTCFAVEVTSLTGPLELGPGGTGAYVVTVDNPNPAGTCDEALEVVLTVNGTANAITRVDVTRGDGGPEMVCSPVPTTERAGAPDATRQRCLASTFGGGASARLAFDVSGIVGADRVGASARALYPADATARAVFRAGGVGEMALMATAPATGSASAPANAPAPAPSPRSAPKPSAPAGSEVGAGSAPAAGSDPAAGADPVAGGAPAPKPTTGGASTASNAPAAGDDPAVGGAPAPKPASGNAPGAQVSGPLPTLRLGDSSVVVVTLQFLLLHHGANLEPDVDFTAQTEAAVRDFQQANGLPVDGVVGRQTWSALFVTVRRGDQGEAVGAVQHRLGYDGFEVGEHGDFDAQTEAAVRDYQRAKGLTVDGVVGPRTWAALVSSE